MRLSHIFVAAILCVIIVMVGGCPIPTDGNGQTTTLTTAQSAAVDDVAEQLAAFASLFGTFVDFTDARLAASSIKQIDTFGECPRVSLISNDTSAAIAFNFGDTGCSSTATGGKTITGGLDIRLTRATGEIEVTFLNFTIDGTGVTGSISATLTRSGDTVTINGQIADTVQIDGVGSISGSLTVVIAANGQITFSTASLMLNDGTTTYNVTLTNVVVDPVSNGNFVPESGTAAFTVTEGTASTTLTVTFNSNTPTTGDVDVAVGASGTANHTIPLP